MLITLNQRAAQASLAAAFSPGLLVALQLLAAYAEGTQPADPQPQADALAPGLAVDYYYLKLDLLDELYNQLDYKKPDSGAPLTNLNFVANEQSSVLGTNRGSIVVAVINRLCPLF